jgi:methylthioribose-1-phosphate isomerase
MGKQAQKPWGEVQPVRWTDRGIVVIDQRSLPLEYRELLLCSLVDVARAIEQMAVRGAPLIGVIAAYGVALTVRFEPSPEAALRAIKRLRCTRPTARDLFAALARIEGVVAQDPADLPQALLAEAQAIHAADLDASSAIGKQADTVFADPGWVLTICNTGALATGGGGTALRLAYEGYWLGLVEGVYVCETRPQLQGSRLTGWELERLGVPFKLLPDSAAAGLLAQGHVVAVAVGADRIARNCDTANKIGTRMLAVLAQESGVPFHVVAPRSTFDGECATGADIPIEERGGDELRLWGETRLVPDGYAVYNPAFDITDAGLITSFVTDAGVIKPDELKGSAIWN